MVDTYKECFLNSYYAISKYTDLEENKPFEILSLIEAFEKCYNGSICKIYNCNGYQEDVLSAWLAVKMVFVPESKPEKIIINYSTMNRSKYMLDRVKHYIKNMPITIINNKHNMFKCSNGSSIQMTSDKNSDGFQATIYVKNYFF